MRVVSVIEDGLLQATNALLEMTVGEYLNIGLRILHKNQYQRKRVSRSSSVYSLLNDDMKKLCSIPTIVLAFTNDAQRICLREGMVEEELSGLLNNDNLIILDGLQRTYTMRDVDSDLLKDKVALITGGLSAVGGAILSAAAAGVKVSAAASAAAAL